MFFPFNYLDSVKFREDSRALFLFKNEIGWVLRDGKKHNFFIKILKLSYQFLSLFLYSFSVHRHDYFNLKASRMNFYLAYIYFRFFINFFVGVLLLDYFIEIIFFSWFLTKNISLSSFFLKNLNYFFQNFTKYLKLIISFFQEMLKFFNCLHFNSLRSPQFIENKDYFQITFVKWFSDDYLKFLSQKMTRNFFTLLILIFKTLNHQNIYLKHLKNYYSYFDYY